MRASTYRPGAACANGRMGVRVCVCGSMPWLCQETSSPSGVAGSWMHCAAYGGWCNVAPPRLCASLKGVAGCAQGDLHLVRYGTGATWAVAHNVPVSKLLCTNAVFGDVAFNRPKNCYVFVSAAAGAAPQVSGAGR